MKYKKKANYNKREALKFWEQGMSYEQLGKFYGYHKSTIKKYIRLYAGDGWKKSWRLHQIKSGAKVYDEPAQERFSFAPPKGKNVLTDELADELAHKYNLRYSLADNSISLLGHRGKTVGSVWFADGVRYYEEI